MREAQDRFAELLLRAFAGRERAAAIYGDLLEIAATRGKIWFWMAYAQTVVALTWRTPVAVVAAVISAKYLRTMAFRLLFGPYALRFNGSRLWAGRQLPYLGHFSWAISWYALLCLWIVLPYVAIRFGLRNRLTYLAGTLFLLALWAYTFNPHVYQVTGLACALVIVAALASPVWRRQMIFLAANCATAYLVFYLCIVHPLGIFRHGLAPRFVFGMRIDDPAAMAVMVMIGPPLYQWLLQPRTVGIANA